MKVVFCIPALDGSIKARCHQSLVATYRILNDAKIPYEEFFVEHCPYLPVARATLAAMFMADSEATDLFFIDSDVGFEASGVIEILKRPEAIVAGVYPLKRDAGGYPVEVKTIDGIPIGRDGLIEANFLPGGFMRIKRIVFEEMAKAYPELRYDESVVEVKDSGITEAYDFFGMGVYGRKFRTEDYAFCQRWRDMGGQVWVYPNINFDHVGTKTYKGNYHEFLLRQPGGAKDFRRLAHLAEIPGWMNLEELAWLTEQAAKHERIVEIGSYLGRSTRALGENTPGVVFAVDDWKGPREVNWSSSDNLFERFCANLRDLIEVGKVRPCCVSHEEWQVQMAGMLPGPDMVFIDGDHAYESVLRDVKWAISNAEAGALICGHDYDWQNVKKAVDELVTERQQVPGTAIWYWQIPARGTTDEQIPLHDVVT